MLRRVVALHSDVHEVPNETRAFCRRWFDDFDETTAVFDLDTFYRDWLDDAPATCTRWCEKSPRNILAFNDILEFFDGNVKLIQIVRDGRDVVTSWHRGQHGTLPNTLWIKPQRWVRDVRAGLAYRDSGHVHTLRYEDLVLDFEQSVESPYRFLEVPFDPDLLSSHAATRDTQVPVDGKLMIFSSSIGRWRGLEPGSDESERVRELLALEGTEELLEIYGYG